MADLSELAQELRELKEQKKETEDHLSEINKRIKTIAEKDLPEAMENRDIDKFTVDGVGTVFIQTKVYSNVKKDDRDKFYAWLRETGNGDVVVDYVHPQTMNAFVKERITEGLDYPEFMNVTLVPTAQLRRS